ncbi:hypothetical protein N0V94_007553 [Neodidymelliopsis sp. IMI 364377]|nr:hypothetical protein N0V94_007553 [Neodidymelliopsis sp. IMI 364377]
MVDSLLQSHQHSDGCDGENIAKPQDTHARCSLCAIQHDQPATVHDNTTGASLERACTYDSAAHKSIASFSGTHDAIYSDEDRAASIDSSNANPNSSGVYKTINDSTDSDSLPSSTDESLDEQGKTSSIADQNDEEPSEIHTPLEFQIPAELLRTAMTAPENTKASFWSSNLYRGPGDKRLSVHYCKTKEVAERVVQHFVNEKVLGFDIEWKPWSSPLSIKKNVSLIQLACEDRIALFHIALFSGTTAAQLMPPTLKAILESPDVYKVGVAVKGDFNRITKYLEVEPQGVFELSRLNNLVQWHAIDPSRVSHKLVSLSTQVQQHLQLPLYKGGRLIDDPEDLSNVRSSDWSLQLNLQQIHYAAADAYAGFRLYDALEKKRKQFRPIPPRPLVCDYDSKSVARSPKPRKKHKSTIKIAEGEVAAATVEAETSISAERREKVEEAGGDSEQTQETEGYETAQEEMIDSHQLEGDMLESSEGSRSELGESEEDSSTESTQSLPEVEEFAADLDMSRKRVGRVSLNRLKGRDLRYPSLPHVRNGEEGRTSSDRDRADDVDPFGEEGSSRSDGITEASEVDPQTSMDEFDDSELEEALQDLNIDSDGRLQRDTTVLAEPDLVLQSDHESSVPEAATETGHVQVEDTDTLHQSVPTSPKPKDNESADPCTVDSMPHEEEQRLIELLGDPEVVEYLHLPLALDNTPSSSPHPTDAAHTPEFELATSWAQTYLQSTIPSPTSRVPSHVRATIPHLRAYNMWHHQELSLAEIAGHLRDPPLSESTVGSYVLQAISLERMEYDKEEVRKVLMAMPEALRKGKWRGLAEKVGAK